MSSAVESAVERVEQQVVRAVLGLPSVVARRLAGRPVVLDGQSLDPHTQLILRLQRVLREPAPETLPMPEARKVIRRQAMLVGGREPIGETRDLEVPGGDGPIPARFYVPRRQVDSPLQDWPMLVFIHGGGMMYGDLDGYDAICRFMAERADVRVLSLDYRLAPEHPYPAAVEDCWAAFRWVSENAERFGVDPERIAIGGDSAGGYLSAVTAIQAAEAGVPVKAQLLVYPMTDMAARTHSRELFGEGFYLTTEFIDLSEEQYLAPTDDRRDPRVSVLHTEKIPANLAPAIIATAGFDPLRDEGEAYAERLAEAGVPVELKRYESLIHSFFNVIVPGSTTRAAVAELAAKLKAAV